MLHRSPLHTGSEGLNTGAKRLLLRALAVAPDVMVQRYAHTEGMVDLQELDAKLTRVYDFGPAASWLIASEARVEDEIRRRRHSVRISREDGLAGALGDVAENLARNQLLSEARLLTLPDPEFLTAVEYSLLAISDVAKRQRMCRNLERILRVRQLPYKLDHLETRFSWIGDPIEHQLAIAPALSALSDDRLADARAEFDNARTELLHGNLRDAANDAGCAVETAMSVLLDVHGRSQPTKQGTQRIQAGPLFDALVAAGLLDRDRDRALIFAPIAVRDHGSHGLGAKPQPLSEAYVRAGVAHAGVVIAYIASKFPPVDPPSERYRS